MLQRNYLDVLFGDAAKATATNTYGIMGHIDGFHLDERMNVHTVAETPTYYGHCHQQAIKKGHYAVDIVHHVGCKVDPLDSGCWGMVESSGHVTKYYRLSKTIAQISHEQVDGSTDETVLY